MFVLQPVEQVTLLDENDHEVMVKAAINRAFTAESTLLQIQKGAFLREKASRKQCSSSQSILENWKPFAGRMDKNSQLPQLEFLTSPLICATVRVT